MGALAASVSPGRAIDGSGTAESEWEKCRALSCLPVISAGEVIDVGRRMVIVAPHPDDELLGFGGLMQLVAAQGNPILLIAATDGCASHPDSEIWPAEKLAWMRPVETLFALNMLDLPAVQVVRLGLQDGNLAGEERTLCARVQELITQDDVVFTPWILDGHPDHEACARASRIATTSCGATLVETPIWGWHWATPATSPIPWQRAKKLLLPPLILARKGRAVQCYHSQVWPDITTGRPAILTADTLAHLLRPHEVYFFGEDTKYGN